MKVSIRILMALISFAAIPTAHAQSGAAVPTPASGSGTPSSDLIAPAAESGAAKPDGWMEAPSPASESAKPAPLTGDDASLLQRMDSLSELSKRLNNGQAGDFADGASGHQKLGQHGHDMLGCVIEQSEATPKASDADIMKRCEDSQLAARNSAASPSSPSVASASQKPGAGVYSGAAKPDGEDAKPAAGATATSPAAQSAQE